MIFWLQSTCLPICTVIIKDNHAIINEMIIKCIKSKQNIKSTERSTINRSTLRSNQTYERIKYDKKFN